MRLEVEGIVTMSPKAGKIRAEIQQLAAPAILRLRGLSKMIPMEYQMSLKNSGRVWGMKGCC